ncbi:cell division protein FtsQ/DivIB [Asticcacaulis sp. AND118]|uniref:cell division protein FtsQ/DivIB n=1 Tax=Asticcacaulis sp. AND118 TaxID=2840468 RepID=UPI001CFF8975|nr:cell division protein FtsQ/DivIB [Asticcacaulis sp. AND118]UDF02827.1 FtsQ-type POTRA domain-containing protein [Asticcacaulis sp. AND118]
MPAVVRGGRRQAAPASKASPRNAPSRARGGRKAEAGKFALIGGVAMPNELTAWLGLVGAAGLMAVFLLTGGRAETLRSGVVSFTDARIASIGINLQNVRLQGVSDVAREDIRKALRFERGQPLALMDLNKVKTDVESVGWVKSAVVRRQLPDQLIITVTERPRLAVWQYQNKTYVIDDTGKVIPEARSGNFIDLPLVVGEEANATSADILRLMQARPELMSKVWALVRVDTRRWDIRLKNNTIIKLPALDQDEALNRLDVLISQQRVLDQGLAVIDLRDPNALVVKPFETVPVS